MNYNFHEYDMQEIKQQNEWNKWRKSNNNEHKIYDKRRGYKVITFKLYNILLTKITTDK